MKARHLRTLEAFLKEYSGAASGQQPVKPGNKPSGPVGSGVQAHDNADVNKANRDRKAAGLPKDATNTELQSKADAGELSSNDPSGTSARSTAASQVNKAPEVNAPTGAGSNISKVATSGSPTTGKGRNQQVGESDKLKKFRPRGAFGRSAVKSTLKKKLPTGRLIKEAEALDFIVEINFNNKEVVKKALNGPVNCGFEAELIFPNIESFDPYGDDGYGEDDTMIDRINNSAYESDIRELYRKTLLDFDNAYGEAFFEFQMDQMNRDFDDEEWVNDFVDDMINQEDVDEYKKETLDRLADEDTEEYEERVDWDEAAWGRELAELNYKDEMQDYWMEMLDEYTLEKLVHRFEDNPRYGIDEWMMDSGEAGNQYWVDANDYLQQGDAESDRSGNSKYKAYQEVEEWLFEWAKRNSHNADIEVGGYHDTTGHDGWRIEEDSSLDGDGQGFEVISPVFDTPKEMLAEIKSLFSYCQATVETNRTTGLHITMSYAEESEVPANIAKTKMYVLSGADNQAKVWGREFNTYSQNTKIQVLKALRSIATGNASEDNIKTMDDMIEKFNASSEAHKIERQSTVNIKRQTNSAGNNLVEFRAAGGPTYLDDFGQVAKDVTRYSATLVASYDPDAYNKEFAKKMYKWLQDAADVEDPQAYSATKGLSPQDVYRQSTGDTTFDVDNHPMTGYMMKFTHSTFHDNVKQALTRFFTSLKNQQEYADKHNLNEYEYKEDPQEVYADFQSSTREALTNLLGYLALSPNTDKMSTKELMAIRKMIRKYGIDEAEFIDALKRDTGNPRLLPDPRDKADRTRIYKRAGRLIGKDLMGDAPEPMAIFIAPSQVALITADGIRYMQQYGETDGAYLPISKNDYAWIKTELDHLNQEFKRSQANPDDVELDTAVRKMAFDLTKSFNNRINKNLDVERVAMRHSDGGLQYALLWQNQIARPHTDPLPASQLKQIGVEVKPTEEKEAPFENLMSKFEGKSLVEQLTILNKLDKRKIDEAHKKMFVTEESVPDTRKASILNKLLSEHFPACDLQKQMEAFTALPIPQMIDDFRAVKRDSGPDGCCRPVLCHYLRYLHPTMYKMVDHSFCDGGDDACKSDKCNESVTEKVQLREGIKDDAQKVIDQVVAVANKKIGRDRWDQFNAPIEFTKGGKSWTRGDGARYKDSAQIAINRYGGADEYKKITGQSPVDTAWNIIKKIGKHVGNIKGEHGSDSYREAYKVGNTLFINHNYSIGVTTPSVLRNKAVWHKQQESLGEAKVDEYRSSSIDKARNRVNRAKTGQQTVGDRVHNAYHKVKNKFTSKKPVKQTGLYHAIKKNELGEAKGIMGRVAGDKFVKGDEQLEFQEVKVYPEDSAQFSSTEERDQAIQSFESQAGPIVWTNTPNKGMLAFGVATLTDPLNNNKPTYWGRYFKQKSTNMMGTWQNNQVPTGWKVQKAGALKLDIGIDPQHLIKVETPFSSIDEVIQAVSMNSKENPLHEQLVSGLEQIKAGQNPVFKDCAQHIPALRDYFGEIMGPCALMAGMVGGQAEDANQALLKGAGWDNSQVFWPQAMNYALVDSVFIGPDGQEVGISSKGGKGAKASAKNIADAIAKAPPELVKKYKFTVNIIKLVEQSSAQEGPFRIAEFLKILPSGLEKEIMSYVKSGKTDYVGLSNDAKELFNYGTPKTDAPGFNTGLALTALLAKKVAKKVNENPTFSDGAISFLNQSSIVQLYCKMGKQGNNARVTGWDAIYPPNFKGRVVLDGSKNYYSSRIGGKFAFGFV